MKFLTKDSGSDILASGMTYQKNKAENNRLLREKLLIEQHQFCAYTEKYIEELDSVEVEHFDSSKKYADDYFNYYAVLRWANNQKADEKYQKKGASFFTTLFFHDRVKFEQRVQYDAADMVYEEIDDTDIEAEELIDFLGFNHPNLFEQRRKHINRLKSIFKEAGFTEVQVLDYLQRHPEELSFITAIEAEFGIDLSAHYS